MFTQLYNSIGMAFAALASNKARALLTMLGIIIGVASVIALNSIGQGAARDIANRINSMGTNLLQIDPGPSMRNGLSSGAGGSVHLVEKDAEALKASPFLKNVEPSVDGRVQAVGGNSNWNTRIIGTTPTCLGIRNYNIADGANFSDEDVSSVRKVCVIGKTVAQNLFGKSNPIGKDIRIAGVPLQVVGLLAEKGFNANGFDQDDIIIGPLTTVQKRITGKTWLDDIFVTTISSDVTQVAIEEVTDILRTQHHLLPNTNSDFRVRSEVEIAKAAAASTETLSDLLRNAAIVALLVGGIGIMNIMLVSVTERTREIGIRKSIGAKSFSIMMQFITEALMLSLVGGSIGVLAGVAASYLLAKSNGWVLLISPEAIILSFLASTLVGLFFGFYPARKAAKLDPIEALRFD